MLKWLDVLKCNRYGNPEPEKKIEKSPAEWSEILSPEVFRITRMRATEAAHSSELCNRFEPGEYACACCGSLLFDAQEKYDSQSGWPSFSQPVDKKAVAYLPDYSLKQKRIEARCNSCQAHLGHIFPDGPPPANLRFCINGLALKRVENPYRKAIFGGGCFWCTEALFQQLKGVVSVEPGYAGGRTLNPTYREVCSGLTDHAEVVRITFDPQLITFQDLIRLHLSTHNPTLKQEKKDQYRSLIISYTEAQADTAKSVISEIQAEFDKPITTELKAYEAFYPAEEKHQNYYRSNPEKAYCQAVINPKLAKLRKQFLPFLYQQ